MKQVNLYDANNFSDKGMKKLLVHDPPYFKILNFNFKPDRNSPVHSHDRMRPTGPNSWGNIL